MSYLAIVRTDNKSYADWHGQIIDVPECIYEFFAFGDSILGNANWLHFDGRTLRYDEPTAHDDGTNKHGQAFIVYGFDDGTKMTITRYNAMPIKGDYLGTYQGIACPMCWGDDVTSNGKRLVYYREHGLPADAECNECSVTFPIHEFYDDDKLMDSSPVLRLIKSVLHYLPF